MRILLVVVTKVYFTFLGLFSIVGKGLFYDYKITVYSTLLIYGRNIHKKPQFSMAKDYKAITNNTTCIGKGIYDINYIVHASTVHNHLCPWTYAQIQEKSGGYLCQLRYILKRKHAPSKVHAVLLKNLENICSEKFLTWPPKKALWDKIILEHHENIPKDYGLPMVIRMIDCPCIIKSHKNSYEKVRVNPDILEDPAKVRKAISGALAYEGLQRLRNAAFVTEGAISLDSVIMQEEVD